MLPDLKCCGKIGNAWHVLATCCDMSATPTTEHKDTMPRQKCCPNKNNNCEIESFSANGSAMRKLMTHQDKVGTPKVSEKHMAQWHHEVPCHPGATCTEAVF